MPVWSLEYTMQWETEGGGAGQDSTSCGNFRALQANQNLQAGFCKRWRQGSPPFTAIPARRRTPSPCSWGNRRWTSSVTCPRSHKSFCDLLPTLPYLTPHSIPCVFFSLVREVMLAPWVCRVISRLLSPHLGMLFLLLSGWWTTHSPRPLSNFLSFWKALLTRGTSQQSPALIRTELFMVLRATCAVSA